MTGSPDIDLPPSNRAVSQHQLAAVAGHTAGFVSRMAAFVIDLAVINAMLLATIVVASSVLNYFNFGGLFRTANSPTWLAQVVVGTISAIGFLITYFGYPVFFWVLIGQTPGKLLLGLRVVQTDGQLLSVRRGLLRALAYWLSALPLFLGFAWIIIDDQRQGWHDKLGRTYVIYYRRQRSTR